VSASAARRTNPKSRLANDRRKNTECSQEMIMKTLVASALVALSLLSTAAQAATYDGYPELARRAFEIATH
jgi:hypothetical protein